MLPDESAFRSHIDQAPFLIGVDDGLWGICGSPEAIIWPHVDIWCKATPPKNLGSDRYYFHFNLAGYPADAPTAMLWDTDRKDMLEISKWPHWSVHLQDVCKPGWQGGRALYAPCDRSSVANNSHAEWQQKHKAFYWRPESTIVQYLRFLSRILNQE